MKTGCKKLNPDDSIEMDPERKKKKIKKLKWNPETEDKFQNQKVGGKSCTEANMEYRRKIQNPEPKY